MILMLGQSLGIKSPLSIDGWVVSYTQLIYESSQRISDW